MTLSLPLSPSLSYLEAVLELISCGGEVPTLKARHAPGSPHSTRVQLTLSGDFHCQTEPVVLDKTVTDTSGEIWLGEFLDGGDLGPARGDEESEEVYTTQVAGGRGEEEACG